MREGLTNLSNKQMRNIPGLAVSVISVLAATQLAAQAATPVNLYVADLKYDKGSVTVSNPRKLTGDRGNNSQPSFTPDGKSILFIGRRDSAGQGDVYRIDLATGVETQITRTAENENSPTVTPDGKLMVIRWVPATLFKEWGPWIYDMNGNPLSGVLPAPDTVGYYVRIDSVTFAMMRPKSRPAVALFDTRKGTMTDYAWPVANLPPQLIPHRHAISFTQTDSLGHNEIRSLDLTTLQSSAVAPALVGRTIHTWTPNGLLLMGKGNAIYSLKPGTTSAWKKVADFRQPDLQSVNTYVVSPAGDKIILISPLKPSIQLALRDSILANRPVNAVLSSYRRNIASITKGYDLAEGGILSLANERSRRGKTDEGIAIARFDAELHPKSYDAQMTLGSLLAKAGDSKGSVDAYRKSLELNPRISADDKAAAEEAEKAIAKSDSH